MFPVPCAASAGTLHAAERHELDDLLYVEHRRVGRFIEDYGSQRRVLAEELHCPLLSLFGTRGFDESRGVEPEAPALAVEFDPVVLAVHENLELPHQDRGAPAHPRAMLRFTSVQRLDLPVA